MIKSHVAVTYRSVCLYEQYPKYKLQVTKTRNRSFRRHSSLMISWHGTEVRVVHGLGWVGSGWVEIFQFFVGWVGFTTAKALKI